jgi:predicted RNA-binding protein YlqC (UPF0109 family)
MPETDELQPNRILEIIIMTTLNTNTAARTADPLFDEDLLLECVTALVDEPEQVHVTVKENDQGKLLVVHCAVADRGKVIGKDGCNIQALSTLFRSIGNFDSRRVLVALENLALKDQQ